ncbi:TnpV protein [Ruminococcus sp. OM05-10BH]|nr:TnpV protein [Ruminococcus sp. OM05-10BH]
MFQVMKMDYTNRAGFLIPNIQMDEQPKQPMGRFGRMRKAYLKENHSGLYQGMLLSGKLTAHLMEIDRTADERMERLTESMAKAEGVNEALKAENQMQWLQRMSNIQSRAEEMVLSEIVYS